MSKIVEGTNIELIVNAHLEDGRVLPPNRRYTVIRIDNTSHCTRYFIDNTEDGFVYNDEFRVIDLPEIDHGNLPNKVENSAHEESIRDYNVGDSNYAEFKIQPWDIWLEYGLNPWDADIIKRTLRTKKGEERKLDYEKIIHICKERIRQIDS